MPAWKWKYYSLSKGDWHHTFTGYYKVKIDFITGEEIGKPISISYGEYINKERYI